MALKLRFHPSVPDDLVEALDYYDAIATELGNQFRRNVRQRLSSIAERPNAFLADVAPIRFAKVAKSPYLIFFVPKRDYVSILAIVHGSSEPGKWRGRVDRAPG